MLMVLHKLLLPFPRINDNSMQMYALLMLSLINCFIHIWNIVYFHDYGFWSLNWDRVD